MNMKQWMLDLRDAKVKKSIPVLSFPSITLMDITVKELINDPEKQAKGMKMIADRVPSAASVSMMDLSVEAEAFGSTIHVSDDEVPTVVGAIATDEDEADALEVPEVGAGRTGLYVEAIGKAVELITDRPVFAGIIGPYSLAGRLIDVTEALMMCYEDPDTVHTVLRKATDFLKEYAMAYKKVGAHGIVMAEPLAGLLSPKLMEEFSEPYVKEVVDYVQDDNFVVILHDCGPNAAIGIESILRTGAAGLHFGDAIEMKDVMPHIPEDVIAMGNVSPAGQFRGGTVESIKAETKRIMSECCKYPNFLISSGCDIPPMSPWENIDAYFEAIDEFYAENA